MKAETKRNIKINGYKSNVLHAKREKRQREADARQAAHDLLTKKQKLAKAKSRRGESKVEIARLS
jgi:hypothetical protein